MGVLSFLSKKSAVASPAPNASQPAVQAAAAAKPSREAGLEKLEADFGVGLRSTTHRIREAVNWHRTGRKSDAWAAFDAMLSDPEFVAVPAARLPAEAEVYAWMRLCHEREGCFAAALTPAVLTYVTRLRQYAAEHRAEAVATMREPEFFVRYFKPLLVRARVEHAQAKFRSVVEEHLSTIPMVDMVALKEAVEAFRLNPPPVPARVVERVAGKLYIPNSAFG